MAAAATAAATDSERGWRQTVPSRGTRPRSTRGSIPRGDARRGRDEKYTTIVDFSACQLPVRPAPGTNAAALWSHDVPQLRGAPDPGAPPRTAPANRPRWPRGANRAREAPPRTAPANRARWPRGASSPREPRSLAARREQRPPASHRRLPFEQLDMHNQPFWTDRTFLERWEEFYGRRLHNLVRQRRAEHAGTC